MLGHNWTHDRDWVLAGIADTLQQLLVLTANVNRGEGQAAIPAPEPLPRPGQDANRLTPEEEAEERAAHRRRVAALLPGRK